MQYGVIHAPVVPVYCCPMLEFFSIGKCFFIFWICVAQKVPRRASPVGHHVRLPLRFPFATRTPHVHPTFYSSQWRFASIGRQILFDIGEFYRKMVFKYRNPTRIDLLSQAFEFLFFCEMFTIHQRYRLTPVALTRENPVAEFVLGGDVAANKFYNF